MNSEEKKSDAGCSQRELKPSTLVGRELSSETIFAGSKAVTITHDGVAYRLLITRNNKLILQK